jgi:FkbM family methyltransferase
MQMRQGLGAHFRGLVERIAARRGYVVMPKWRLQSFPLATRLRQLFVHHRIETVIDVGANEGQYRDFLRNQVGFDGRIESFEPTPTLVARLHEKARADRDWKIHPVALGSSEGALQLNLMQETVLNSFHQPAPGSSAFEGYVILGTTTVPVRTLDSVFGDYIGLERTYLKLDTQGYDLEILKGAPFVVSKVPALQTEVSMVPLYETMPNYREALDAFAAYGFAVADMFLVATDNQEVALEFDCIMVRPSS